MREIQKNIPIEDEHLPTASELYLARLNVKRSLLVCAFALLFQVTNLFGEHMRIYEYMRIASGATVAVVLVYFVFAMLIYFRNPNITVNRMKKMYGIFWVVFTLQMTPFFWADVLYSQTPVNMIVFGTALAVCPVFKKKSIVYLYPFLFLYMFANVVIAGADLELVMTSIAVIIVCMTIAINVQSSTYHLVSSLYKESETDGLTKIYNRKAGIARMVSLLALGKRMERDVAAFFIDIDHFKNYNDSYGHLEGDKALSAVSACVQQCFSRETDVLCRIGGEEFAVMVFVNKKEDAVDLAKQLLHMVSQLQIPSGEGATYAYISVSIGVTMLHGFHRAANEEAVTAFIEAADRELYNAKRNDRNCISFQGEIIPGDFLPLK